VNTDSGIRYGITLRYLVTRLSLKVVYL
jgi:hypothetical protein